MEARLADQDILSADAAQAIHDEVRQQVQDAVAFAKASPMPEPSALLEDVYA
jgi:TPP-dependent pyruvate/acetoin dehydrogenase alpha subunit